MGRVLIASGLLLVVLGVVILLGERLPLKLGRLPGDVVIHGKNGTFYFPIVTCLLVSVVLTVASWLIGKR